MTAAVNTVALIAIAVSLTGCGRYTDSPSALGAAASSTERAGTARFESVTRSTYDEETTTYRTTGVVDFAGKRSDQTWAEEEVGSSRMIMIGDVVYTELSFDHLELPDGKAWISFDMSKLEQEFEKYDDVDDAEAELDVADDAGSSATVHVSSDIGIGFGLDLYSNGLDFLSNIDVQPVVVGPEIVRGISTTKYRVALDLRKAAARDLRERGWKPETIERAVRDTPAEPAMVEVCVDDDGLIRRIVLNHEYRLDDGSFYATSNTTDYYDFGLDVTITAPPGDAVMTWTAFEALIAEQSSVASGEDDLSEP